MILDFLWLTFEHIYAIFYKLRETLLKKAVLGLPIKIFVIIVMEIIHSLLLMDISQKNVITFMLLFFYFGIFLVSMIFNLHCSPYIIKKIDYNNCSSYFKYIFQTMQFLHYLLSIFAQESRSFFLHITN